MTKKILALVVCFILLSPAFLSLSVHAGDGTTSADSEEVMPVAVPISYNPSLEERKAALEDSITQKKTQIDQLIANKQSHFQELRANAKSELCDRVTSRVDSLVTKYNEIREKQAQRYATIKLNLENAVKRLQLFRIDTTNVEGKLEDLNVRILTFRSKMDDFVIKLDQTVTIACVQGRVQEYKDKVAELKTDFQEMKTEAQDIVSTFKDKVKTAFEDIKGNLGR